MNRVVLVGRLTQDPELRYIPSSGKAVANLRLAVNRPYSQDNKADFFRVVVWGKTAENASKYLSKGSQCAVSGSIEINQYTDRDGNNRYATDIVADRVEFLGSPKGAERSNDPYEAPAGDDLEDDFQSVEDDDLPF